MTKMNEIAERSPLIMKRLLPLLLALCLMAGACLADPLPLLEDLTGEITVPYEEGGTGGAAFTYRYRYPAADPSHPDAAIVNTFFDYEISDTVNFRAPMDAENWAPTGESAEKDVTYTVTCNNDDFFSVLVCTTETTSQGVLATYAGNTFSRSEKRPGYTTTLPQILGILSSYESDTWLQDRQTARADAYVRAIIWERIEENPEDLPFWDTLTVDDLEYIFYPEEDFYLDETGNPVFFLQPGDAAPPEAGLMTFPLTLEEILDEM